ncbi:hypothetical protein KUA24_73 [Vibrio phage HNL01]|nr:hypothetical protein KUA24_73 [Vibrio phage HNL01]
MTTITTIHNTQIIDNQTGRVVSATELVNRGDWQFIQLGNYTSATPLTIAEGTTSKFTFQPEDIIYTTGNVPITAYDFVNQVFRPPTLGDMYCGEMRCIAKCSRQNGYGDYKIEVPTSAINPVQGETIGIPRGAGIEQFVSITGMFFVGQDMLDNGFELKFSSVSGNFDIYNISFLWCRIASASNL